MLSKKVVALVAVLLLAVVPTVLAQDACEGNFNCDGDVDGTDAAVFKADFGRGEYNNPGNTKVTRTSTTTTEPVGRMERKPIKGYVYIRKTNR